MEIRNYINESYKMFIDGQWCDASDQGTFKSYCPANGEFLAQCPQATKEDVDRAVDSAWKAFASWKNTTVSERSDILMKIADVIDANKERLAMVESLDNGKPIRETMAIDVPYAADHFRYFAGVIRGKRAAPQCWITIR